MEGHILYYPSKITSKIFIRMCLNRFDESVHIIDVMNWIMDKYMFMISQQKVKELAEEIGYYYDDTFEKIYKKKKLFLKEAFDNE